MYYERLEVFYSPDKGFGSGPRNQEEIEWVSKERLCLLGAEKEIQDVEIPGRRIKIGITPTNFSRLPELPPYSIFLVSLANLISHECPDPKLVVTPVNISEVGWRGPAISGFLLNKNGEIVVPNGNQTITWLDDPEIRAVVIDGANRTNTMGLLKEIYQRPGRTPIVPFQAWNYLKLFMGKFECSDFQATHQDVITAALTGKLIPPKGSRHGIVLSAGQKEKTVSPVALCQPVLEISLEDLF